MGENVMVLWKIRVNQKGHLLLILERVCIFIGSFVKRIAKDAANVTPDKPVKNQFWKSSIELTTNEEVAKQKYLQHSTAAQRVLLSY